MGKNFGRVNRIYRDLYENKAVLEYKSKQLSSPSNISKASWIGKEASISTANQIADECSSEKKLEKRRLYRTEYEREFETKSLQSRRIPPKPLICTCRTAASFSEVG